MAHKGPIDDEHRDKDARILLEEIYRPNDEIRGFIYDVYDKLIRWRALRDSSYKQFRNGNLIDYLQEARQKYWGFLPLNFDSETPAFFFPETRNQISILMSKIANLRMKPAFEGVEGFDIVKAMLLKDLFDYWRRGANRKIQNFWQFLYCVINGTVIVHVGYESKIREVKRITLYNPDTGQTKYVKDELDDSDVKETIVNLEDFYFPKLWEPDVQEQDEVIWRTLMKYSDFKHAFEGYSNSATVFPGAQFSDSSIFADFLSYDVRGGEFVEVIRYFSKPRDKYAIIANGVLLNPYTDADDGEEKVAPLPWNHKCLPFAKTILDPIDNNFFYGMPLAQRVRDPQEATNRMWQLMLAREERSIAAPIITSDTSSEFGIKFKPGRIYQVQAPVNEFKELQVAPTSASYWNALNSLQGIIGRTAQGGIGDTMPSRQPRSATEKAQQAQQLKEAMGLPFLFYQDLMEQRAWLIIQNMIQFYTSHKVEKVLGGRKFHKILSLAQTQLQGGGMGNREIRIVEGKTETADHLKQEAYLRSLLRKERVEIIEVTPDELRQLKFDIKINFEMESSPEGERALYLDFVSTMLKLFGQSNLLSLKKMLYRTIEKFNENVTDYVDENTAMQYEQERFGSEDQGAQAPGSQMMNQYMQSLRGQRFGAQAQTLAPGGTAPGMEGGGQAMGADMGGGPSAPDMSGGGMPQ